MAMSKTNTDDLCFDTTNSSRIPAWIRLAQYRYNLWTGLYMLESHERYAFNLVAGTFVIAATVYFGSFVAGFTNGLFSL